jgi:hypothetical protein
LSNIFYLKACHASTHLILPVHIHSSLSIILQLGSLISCYHLISIWLPTSHFCSASPFCFILSTLRLVCTPTYSSISLSVTHQARYRFSDSPNFSDVDFVPHATSCSFQIDSPFLPKLTSRLHSFFFFPLHYHPIRKHPNSSSPSDSSVPNIGCPGPSILFICPFVLRWETVVDRSPLPFQFSGYRQHCCAVPDLS